jgi:hypothetical protein
MRQKGSTGQHRTKHVDCDCLHPRIPVHVLDEPLGTVDTRVVDEHLQPWKRSQRGARKRVDVMRTRHVGWRREHPLTITRQRLYLRPGPFEHRSVARAEKDARPCLDVRPRDRETEPLVGAGDERSASLERSASHRLRTPTL